MILVIPKYPICARPIGNYGSYRSPRGGWNPISDDWVPPHRMCSNETHINLGGAMSEWQCNLERDHVGPHLGWGGLNHVYEWADNMTPIRITIS